jgi:LmbE family N-acetylglucosaminyl deacetylase
MKKSSKTRLIIMAHPDDPELACGGTIALWERTDRIYYILLSSGDKGSWHRDDSPYEIARLREKEAQHAAQYLGVKKVVFLRQVDGAIAHNNMIALELAMLIRHYKPHTVVTHDPWRRQFHPDHRATGLAVIDAIMIARDWHFSPAMMEIGLKKHRARELLLTPTDNPNVIHDITSTFRKKINAIKKHKSQLTNLYRWEQRITRRAREEGENSGYQYAEGFFRMRV